MPNTYFKENILIVDDSFANVMLLEHLLEEAGYENILSTTDPRDVVDIFNNNNIDIILLDIRMPHMSGIEVMQRLKQHIDDDDCLPVLVLTAQTDVETRQDALSHGARDFLSKPFEIWEVLQRIHNMLETRYFYKKKKIRSEILEREVQKRTKIIAETQLEIMQCLGRVGEYRDNETGAHVLRMSRACQILAKKAELGEGFGNLILHASTMHDIGKIGIADSILLKPGFLTPSEREVMEGHVNIGVEIIGEFKTPMLEMARRIILTHHEKWDGSGYPNGLSGLEIPIEGRITAICDVFDALTSSRPYKKAWPVEKAIDFLKENSGIHFDPKLIEVFLEIIPDILKLQQRFSDEKFT